MIKKKVGKIERRKGRKRSVKRIKSRNSRWRRKERRRNIINGSKRMRKKEK